MNLLDSTYFNSIQNINIHKCQIANCYDLLKVKLDHMASKNNYKKKNKNYTIDDYMKMKQKMLNNIYICFSFTIIFINDFFFYYII